MFFCLGTEGSNGSLFRNGWFQWFSFWELIVPMDPYLEIDGSNVFLFRFQWNLLKVPKVPYSEMGGSNVSFIGTEGSKGSPFRKGWFQCFSV